MQFSSFSWPQQWSLLLYKKDQNLLIYAQVLSIESFHFQLPVKISPLKSFVPINTRKILRELQWQRLWVEMIRYIPWIVRSHLVTTMRLLIYSVDMNMLSEVELLFRVVLLHAKTSLVWGDGLILCGFDGVMYCDAVVAALLLCCCCLVLCLFYSFLLQREKEERERRKKKGVWAPHTRTTNNIVKSIKRNHENK